jgi:thiamine biosynthesis lipoprotein
MLMRADGQIEMTAAMAEQVRLSDPKQTPLIRQVP